MKENTHTIHAIVSPLASNDMANVLLSLNQAPFLAEYYKEVYEITKNSHTLLVNLGTINENKLISIREALKSAKENNVPIILDPVGASASKVRLKTVNYYLKNYPISVLKGNYSEIYSIYHNNLSTTGVDSKNINKEEIIRVCQKLSTMYNIIVVATGKEDIICDEKETLLLKNGSPLLPKVTSIISPTFTREPGFAIFPFIKTLPFSQASFATCLRFIILEFFKNLSILIA